MAYGGVRLGLYLHGCFCLYLDETTLPLKFSFLSNYKVAQVCAV
jgi:hypothetical protein